MCKKKLFILFLILICNYAIAQEDAIRFFDLEPKPTISLLDDRTYDKPSNSLSISGNIYTLKNRSINMAQEIQYKENHKQYLITIYQSRVNQQQERLSQNTTSNNIEKNEDDPTIRLNGNYRYQPYGWQEQFYRSSSLWQPSFYQQSSFGRLRANRRMF